MLKTTRRGLFSYLAAALAWLIGRRVVATPTTTDVVKESGLAGPTTPVVANSPMPTLVTLVYSYDGIHTFPNAHTTTCVYDGAGTLICRSQGSITTFTYDAGGW